jgi:hypothetical protein
MWRKRAVVDVKTAEAAYTTAKEADDKLRANSVMHRAAAAWFGVDVAKLDNDQFQTFKKWAMFGLAAATSTVTMMVGIVSNMARKDGKSGPLGRAIRAWLARHRKKVVRVVEKVVHAPALKVLEIKYVPFDPDSGRVIHADGSLGDFVPNSAAKGA